LIIPDYQAPAHRGLFIYQEKYVLKIIEAATARRTLLKRQPPDEFPVPQSVLDGIKRLFGEPLTPENAVRRILTDVRRRGDAALREWSLRLDGFAAETLRIPGGQLTAALEAIPAAERTALETSAGRIRSFYQHQPLHSWIVQDGEGTLGQLVRPIRRVGLYVPGGTAPLPSTVLMSAIPAQVAGVPEIVVATPPQRGSGQVDPLILGACALLGIDEVNILGGAQAIAALAFGSETIRPVDKIVGPGNLFVTIAKRQVFGAVSIDGLAGPTETVVIADESANPAWVAADLLAQAEHDVLASAILLTPSRQLAEAVQLGAARRMEELPRAEILAQSLSNRSGLVITRDLSEAVEIANAYAPEHLCLSVTEPWRWCEQIDAAGGIFLGEHSCEVLGDYIAGPSHVMPTGGSARYASPLNVWDFVHLVSLVALEPETAAQLSPSAAILARAEGLEAHAQAADLRAA
jgi:histidinol dehydrogenase